MRLRNNGEVNSVAFSTDGKSLAAAGTWTTSVWDVATGRELSQFKGKIRASAITFSKDGRTLMAALGGRVLQRFDLSTGNLVGEAGTSREDFGQDRFNPHHAAFSPDGRILELTDHGDNVRLIEIATEKRLLHIEKSQGIFSVALSHNGKMLVTGGQDHMARLWDVATGKEVRLMKGHRNWVYSVQFSPDDKIIATAAGEELRFWEAATGKLLREIPEGGGRLAFSPDGRILAAGQHDTIHLWDVTTGKEIRQLRGHGSWLIPDLAFSPDGKVLASGSRDHSIILWDVSTGEPLHRFEGHRGAIISMAFSPDGRTLASGGDEDGTLIIWDLSSNKPKHFCKHPQQWVLCLAFSPDGKTIATGDGSNGTDDHEAQIRFWYASDGTLKRQFFGHLNSVQSLAFSPDGTRLASSGWDARCRIWDATTGKKLYQIRGADGLKTIVFTPDGKSLLVTNHLEGGTTAWRVDTGEKLDDPKNVTNISQFLVDQNRPYRKRWECVAHSPDGRTLAVSDDQYQSSKIRLYDLKSEKLLGEWTAHDGHISSLAFSPDGKTLASGSWDTTVILWDVQRIRLTCLWYRLAYEEKEAALAQTHLLANEEGTVPFLKQRLRQAGSLEEQFASRVAELDDERFEVRERASHHLESAGRKAEFALRLALEGTTSAEVKRRARNLLETLNGTSQEKLLNLVAKTPPDKVGELAEQLLALGPDAEPEIRGALEMLRAQPANLGALRRTAESCLEHVLERMRIPQGSKVIITPKAAIRSMSLLEQIGTVEARQALEELAQGSSESRICREAKAILARMPKHGKKQ